MGPCTLPGSMASGANRLLRHLLVLLSLVVVNGQMKAGPKVWGEADYWVNLEFIDVSEGSLNPSFSPDKTDFELYIKNTHTGTVVFTLGLQLDKYDLLYTPSIEVDGCAAKMQDGKVAEKGTMDYSPLNTISCKVNLNVNDDPVDKIVTITLYDPKSATAGPFGLGGSRREHSYKINIKQPPPFEKVVRATSIVVKNAEGAVIAGDPPFTKDCEAVEFKYDVPGNESGVIVEVECAPQATSLLYNGEEVAKNPPGPVKVSKPVTMTAPKLTELFQCMYDDIKWTKNAMQRTYEIVLERAVDLEKVLKKLALDLLVMPEQGQCNRFPLEIDQAPQSWTCHVLSKKVNFVALYPTDQVECFIENKHATQKINLPSGLPTEVDLCDEFMDDYHLLVVSGKDEAKLKIDMTVVATCETLQCKTAKNGPWVHKKKTLSAKASSCKGKSCTLEDDLLTCCTRPQKCKDAFSAAATGWQNCPATGADPKVVTADNCSSVECTADDFKTCCVAHAPCKDFTGTCVGHTVRDESKKCKGYPCVESDSELCCQPKQQCKDAFGPNREGDFECPLIILAKDGYCQGLKCDGKLDGECCQGSSPCSEMEEGCPTGYGINVNQTCKSRFCDSEDMDRCCVKIELCEEAFGKDKSGKFKCDGTKYVNEGQPCAGLKCAESDAPTCCLQEASCKAFCKLGVDCGPGTKLDVSSTCAKKECAKSDKDKCCKHVPLCQEFFGKDKVGDFKCDGTNTVVNDLECSGWYLPDRNRLEEAIPSSGWKCTEKDASKCCVPRGSCKDFLGQDDIDDCGAGKGINASAHCAGEYCKAEDKTKCCAPLGTCQAGFTCPTHFKVNVSQQCLGVECLAADCCVPLQSCEDGFGGDDLSCESDEFVAPGQYCADEKCCDGDHQTCCLKRKPCEAEFTSNGQQGLQFSCPIGHNVNKGAYCAGQECREADQDGCCSWLITTTTTSTRTTTGCVGEALHGFGKLPKDIFGMVPHFLPDDPVSEVLGNFQSCTTDAANSLTQQQFRDCFMKKPEVEVFFKKAREESLTAAAKFGVVDTNGDGKVDLDEFLGSADVSSVETQRIFLAQLFKDRKAQDGTSGSGLTVPAFYDLSDNTYVKLVLRSVTVAAPTAPTPGAFVVQGDFSFSVPDKRQYLNKPVELISREVISSRLAMDKDFVKVSLSCPTPRVSLNRRLHEQAVIVLSYKISVPASRAGEFSVGDVKATLSLLDILTNLNQRLFEDLSLPSVTPVSATAPSSKIYTPDEEQYSEEAELDVMAVFTALDTNGDGQVSQAEFLAGVKLPNKALGDAVRARLQRFFEQGAEECGSDKLNIDAFEAVMKQPAVYALYNALAAPVPKDSDELFAFLNRKQSGQADALLTQAEIFKYCLDATGKVGHSELAILAREFLKTDASGCLNLQQLKTLLSDSKKAKSWFAKHLGEDYPASDILQRFDTSKDTKVCLDELYTGFKDLRKRAGEDKPYTLSFDYVVRSRARFYFSQGCYPEPERTCGTEDPENPGIYLGTSTGSSQSKLATCYYDEGCSQIPPTNGGIGCFAGGYPHCRYCGGEYEPKCPAFFRCLEAREPMDYWPEEQKDFCCKHYKLGCPMIFDCSGDDYSGWTESHKGWCCQHFKVGCPFDCATSPVTWSQKQKFWCSVFSSDPSATAVAAAEIGRSSADEGPEGLATSPAWDTHSIAAATLISVALVTALALFTFSVRREAASRCLSLTSHCADHQGYTAVVALD